MDVILHKHSSHKKNDLFLFLGFWSYFNSTLGVIYEFMCYRTRY